jgi:hypothetical protein
MGSSGKVYLWQSRPADIGANRRWLSGPGFFGAFVQLLSVTYILGATFVILNILGPVEVVRVFFLMVDGFAEPFKVRYALVLGRLSLRYWFRNIHHSHPLPVSTTAVTHHASESPTSSIATVMVTAVPALPSPLVMTTMITVYTRVTETATFTSYASPSPTPMAAPDQATLSSISTQQASPLAAAPSATSMDNTLLEVEDRNSATTLDGRLSRGTSPAPDAPFRDLISVD